MKNKNKRNQVIAQEYSNSPITVLEIATNYGMSAAEVIEILSAQLGDRYRELVELKRQENQGANTMSDNFFHVGDKVQWTNAEGDRVIGVISQKFTKKCWLKPAGADQVGETITGVSLEEIELYSSEPGPIEVALAEMASDNCQTRQLSESVEPVEMDEMESDNCQTRQLSESVEPVEPVELVESVELVELESDNSQSQQLSQWQPGDRVQFFDEDSDQWISGELESVEEESDYCTISTSAGETWFTFASQLEPAEEDSDNNCQSQQLSESVELVESEEENNCQDRQFEEIPETDGDSEKFWLPLEAIAEHPAFQPRGRNWQTSDKGIDSDVVSQYTDWLEFSEPPALEVWFGELEGEEKYWLLAGHHRIRALRKAGRENVECFQWAQSYEEAIYRASTSNAGRGNRTRQVHKMERSEWGEACKAFLRICDRLSPEAVHEFLNEAAALTGQTKKWSKLNNMAIAAVFGISPASVIEYKKQIELEKAASEFPKGTRVLLINYKEIHLLNERKYRLGTVNNFDGTKGLHVIFDYVRCPSNLYHLPSDLVKVDDPPYEKPKTFKVGDRVWGEDKGYGVVVSITSENAVHWLKNTDDEHPLVFWESGRHTNYGMFNVDYEGQVDEIPSIEERLKKLGDYITVDLKDEPDKSFVKTNAVELFEYLKSLVNPSEVQPESTTVKQEEKQQRQAVLGRSTPAGGGGSAGSELPDVSGVNGKHPENPATTAVGPLERPAEVTSLEDAKFYARQSAALSTAASLKVDLPVLPDKELQDIIDAAEAELERRRLESKQNSNLAFEPVQNGLESIAS
ncbi:ParB/Srx family N-terminal domain-containing protein [Laspinema sp. D1]|uniref:ParB/Srx family N-terminal domain-containing protein n=1 Tax=Laspinema palackyanum D2a TaxID=2953684 RepID=A0ABT2MW65_9CYAN|nr:ParB/Srx family N-terminal domain-containing protein [Laspinema sp. D2a]